LKKQSTLLPQNLLPIWISKKKGLPRSGLVQRFGICAAWRPIKLCATIVYTSARNACYKAKLLFSFD